MENNARSKLIIRTSIVGIAANLFLSILKVIIGLLTHSIAIILDAVNNVSDAASSIITIVGTKLAGKAPDRKHPFGHGRVEYLTALVISIIIIYVGITSLTESVEKIFNPDIPEYTTISLIIVAIGVVVKIVLGKYVTKMGEKTDSDSLKNSGADALLDSIISTSTLVAAIIYITTGCSLESYLGAIISLFIIKSGYDMIRETVSRLLGERVDADMAKAIRETVLSFPDVTGAYDLVLNDYGPNTHQGSIHIEIPDTYSASELDELLRSITEAVYIKHHVILAAVGVYSVNTKDEKAIAMKESITSIVLSHDYILEMHGFFVNENKKTIRFDLIISFDAPDRGALYEDIVEDVSEAYPDYSVSVTLDTDYSL